MKDDSECEKTMTTRPGHPRAQRLDKIYKRVEKALEALIEYYTRQTYNS